MFSNFLKPNGTFLLRVRSTNFTLETREIKVITFLTKVILFSVESI